MFDLNANAFAQQLKVMNWRIEQIFQQSSTALVPSDELLLPIAYKELGLASEELQVAAEELLVQNDELAAARSAVETERQRYQDLFEFAPDAYLVTDSTGAIQEANRAACNLLNISPQFLLGKPVTIFVPEAERHGFRDRLNQLHKYDSAQEWITRLCPRKDKPFDAALTIATVRDKQGKPTCLRICIRDITYRTRAASVLNSSDCDFSKDRRQHFYSKGENIPENPQSIWLVVSGVVKLTTVCENGSEVLVGLAGSQSCFGSSLTSLQIYQATALSKNVQLACIALTEIAAYPHLAQAILPKVTLRLQQTESFLAISGQRRVRARLEHLLLLLKQEIGQPVAGGTRLSVRLTHNDLAAACCTTRVTMTRMLGKLQDEGKISFDRKGHIILLHSANC